MKFVPKKCLSRVSSTNRLIFQTCKYSQQIANSRTRNYAQTSQYNSMYTRERQHLQDQCTAHLKTLEFQLELSRLRQEQKYVDMHVGSKMYVYLKSLHTSL